MAIQHQQPQPPSKGPIFKFSLGSGGSGGSTSGVFSGGVPGMGYGSRLAAGMNVVTSRL